MLSVACQNPQKSPSVLCTNLFHFSSLWYFSFVYKSSSVEVILLRIVTLSMSSCCLLLSFYFLLQLGVSEVPCFLRQEFWNAYPSICCIYKLVFYLVSFAKYPKLDSITCYAFINIHTHITNDYVRIILHYFIISI